MTGAEHHVRGAGWAKFAGILLLIVGAFNLTEGVVIYGLTVYGDSFA